MNTSLYYYVKQYKKAFDTNACQQTIQELESTTFERHWYYDNIKKEKFSNEEDCYVSMTDTSTSSLLKDAIINCVDAYQKELEFSWFNKWEGIVRPRFNKYTVGTEMKQHCDHITTLFDGTRRGIPILSILGCLQNSESGGDLILFKDKTVNFMPGDILIFPSNFLFPHRVTPVTNGIRYSFVSWLW